MRAAVGVIRVTLCHVAAIVRSVLPSGNSAGLGVGLGVAANVGGRAVIPGARAVGTGGARRIDLDLQGPLDVDGRAGGGGVGAAARRALVGAPGSGVLVAALGSAGGCGVGAL